MIETYDLDDLSHDERESLRAYKAASDDTGGHNLCFDLNKGLRNGLRACELAPTLHPTLKGLDSVFDRARRTTEDLTVFRGAFHWRMIPLWDSDFRVLQFWSTTLTEASAGSFVRTDGVILTLDLPSGTPVYDMESLEGVGGHERELLLPRGMRWHRVGEAETLEGNAIPDSLRDGKTTRVTRAHLRATTWLSPLDRI